MPFWQQRRDPFDLHAPQAGQRDANGIASEFVEDLLAHFDQQRTFITACKELSSTSLRCVMSGITPTRKWIPVSSVYRVFRINMVRVGLIAAGLSAVSGHRQLVASGAGRHGSRTRQRRTGWPAGFAAAPESRRHAGHAGSDLVLALVSRPLNQCPGVLASAILAVMV